MAGDGIYAFWFGIPVMAGDGIYAFWFDIPVMAGDGIYAFWFGIAVMAGDGIYAFWFGIAVMAGLIACACPRCCRRRILLLKFYLKNIECFPWSDKA